MTTATSTIDSHGSIPIAYRVVQHGARVIRAACAVAFAILATLSFVLAAASATSPRSSLSVGGHDVLIVRSGSMSPAIQTGDAILLRRVNAQSSSNLRVGQVITFRAKANSGLAITHRIVQRNTVADASITYITKGDANSARDDSGVAPDQVIGVVNGRIPRGGFALFALQQPQISGLFLVALMLAHAGVLAARAAVPQQEKRGIHET